MNTYANCLIDFHFTRLIADFHNFSLRDRTTFSAVFVSNL